jgi:autotransporter passenger strand-loop-strand repeat protein
MSRCRALHILVHILFVSQSHAQGQAACNVTQTLSEKQKWGTFETLQSDGYIVETNTLAPCNWHIGMYYRRSSGASDDLLLYLDNVHLSNGGVLNVYDGTDASGTLLNTIDEDHDHLYRIVAKSEDMFITLDTSQVIDGGTVGFDATYHAGNCGGQVVLAETADTFTDGNIERTYFNDPFDCQFLIQPEKFEGKKVTGLVARCSGFNRIL